MRVPVDLAAHAVFVLIQRPLFGTRNMTVVKSCVEALLAADRAILGMESSALRRR